MMITKKWRL